ncbi:DUF4012 domain-containing protein [Propionicimonas sp.]|uniref:DUF4012 domain-containing protein n=1 Tax=Propionicimonas sp. TaxID=1955623 RepID=UPI0039E57D0D
MPEPRETPPEGGPTPEDARSPEPARRAVRRRRRRWPWVTLAVLVVAVLGLGAWLGTRVLTVKTELEAAQASVRSVQAGSGDTETAIRSIASHGAAAVAATQDPVWRAFESVPFVGDNLRAVRLASESLDALTGKLAVPALDAVSTESSTPVLSRIIPVLQSATPRITALSSEISAVQTSSSLVPQVRSGVDQVAGVLDTATPILQLVPGLLGADGAQNYLLVAMNNAEVSGLGGSAASQTLMEAKDGKLTILTQASSQDFEEKLLPNDVGLSDDMIEILGDVMFRRINASMSRPDFPTAATLLKSFWQRDIGKQQIDGVVAIDPIALSHILEATGPIEVGGKKATSENIVRLLLSDAYTLPDVANTSDAFFKAVALAVFQKVADGQFDLKKMVSAVQSGISGGSILFWSANADVQAQVATMRVGGVLPADNTDQTTIGVFFRDASNGSKIDYYMKSAVAAGASCTAAGTTDFTAKVTLHLDISQAAADKLPDYVKSGEWGSTKFLTDVFVYGPPGTEAGKTTLNDGDIGRRAREDLGRPVVKVSVPLKPGETRTITLHFNGTDGDYGPLEVRTTPMVSTTAVKLDDGACGR